MGKKQGNQAYQIKRLTQQKVERLSAEGPWSRAMLAKLRRGIGKQPGELPELFEILFMDMPEELMALIAVTLVGDLHIADAVCIA